MAAVTLWRFAFILIVVSLLVRREDDHPIDNNDDVININIDSPSVSTILDKLRDKSVLILGNTRSALLSIL